MLFESRIGCLDPVVPEETERFIQSINTMFVMTLITMALPSWMYQLCPKPWNDFYQSWDYMFEFGRYDFKYYKYTYTDNSKYVDGKGIGLPEIINQQGELPDSRGSSKEG